MATANRHLGLKLIALALVVTIFATFAIQRINGFPYMNLEPQILF